MEAPPLASYSSEGLYGRWTFTRNGPGVMQPGEPRHRSGAAERWQEHDARGNARCHADRGLYRPTIAGRDSDVLTIADAKGLRVGGIDLQQGLRQQFCYPGRPTCAHPRSVMLARAAREKH